ncbi:menin [Galendromus occidentalis]|uniref:Menin n=1 Tax=Galendromus occidentalis TaxID=34638 RepID=A0AAJ7WJG2_9ACAR|nr:menin [Galendromus occidentalis]
MAISARLRKLFPLKSVDDLVHIFKCMLDGPAPPDLTLASILLGYLENLLCAKPLDPTSSDSDSQSSGHEDFPIVNFEEINALYGNFASFIKGSIDLSIQQTGPQRRLNRQLVKKISDIIWNTLHRSYGQDRPHLQSIFSYLTGNKLDCFGLAYTTVAACQMLSLSDVNLVLSEDHAWIVYVNAQTGNKETAEVTWHGKVEDKRGQEISYGEKSWLYLNGHAIECSKYTEIAAAILAVNPYATSSADSEMLIHIQKKLLWLMHDAGHLRHYPMALGILGELESIQDTPEAEHSSLELFREAVDIARTVYADHHVYPYTYLGCFMFRSQRFSEALRCYANAAQVIRNFNYGREDEEIYKEFMEVNNEIIPQLVRYPGIPEDKTCFAQLLRLWDGLCGWEEGSSTPVLHIGWAQPFVSTLGKFPAATRKGVNIVIWEDPSTQDEGKLKEIKTENEQLSPSAVDSKENSRDDKKAELPTRRGSQSRKSRNEKDIKEKEKIEPKDTILTTGPVQQDLNENEVKKETDSGAPKVSDDERRFREENEKKPHTVVFSSQKMIRSKNLLLADKLNTSAIILQLTAQSNINTHKHKLGIDEDRRTKRFRRD